MTATDQDAEQFREAMSRVPMAVHVVTTDGPGGRHGATATAVASVTDAPPTLLVCLNRASTILARIAQNGTVAVNVLGVEQEDVARAFAQPSGGVPDDRFARGDWARLATGAPTLSNAIAVFDGRVAARHDVGSHAILIVRLEAVRASDNERPGLLYHRRDYAGASDVHNG